MSLDRPEKPLLEALEGGPLVVDGAMGTQLYEAGVLFGACLEELNLSCPELVHRVHEDYVRAGAQVLETNTFGAHAMRLEKHGLYARVREINLAAVEIARRAAQGRAYVMGAIGPSGYSLGGLDLAEVKSALAEQARALVEGGVDALIVETMRQTNELRIGVEAAIAASGGKIPVIASASLDEHGLMADGTTAAEIACLAEAWGARLVGVNCGGGPMGVMAAIENMKDAGLPLFAAPSAGLPRKIGERLTYVSTAEDFGVYACRMLKLGVKMIGGCCGTTPEHITRTAASFRTAAFAAGAAARLRA
jgi:homocysteine S-methyltransferase